MELFQYLVILRKWWHLIVGATVLAAGAALLSSFVLPPIYEAEAQVAIVTERGDRPCNCVSYARQPCSYPAGETGRKQGSATTPVPRSNSRSAPGTRSRSARRTRTAASPSRRP